MRSFLVDVNVWVALSYDRHIHYAAAHRWFEDVGPGEAAFCRLTQLGYLRLLTNPRVMGEEVRTPRQAWGIYDLLCEDLRVAFVSEPPEVEATFRDITRGFPVGAAVWTDAYVAAVARVRKMRIVSFDRGFGALAGPDALILR